MLECKLIREKSMKTEEIRKTEKKAAINSQSNGNRKSKKTKPISEMTADELTLLAWKMTYENHQKGKRLD